MSPLEQSNSSCCAFVVVSGSVEHSLLQAFEHGRLDLPVRPAGSGAPSRGVTRWPPGSPGCIRVARPARHPAPSATAPGWARPSRQDLRRWHRARAIARAGPLPCSSACSRPRSASRRTPSDSSTRATATPVRSLPAVQWTMVAPCSAWSSAANTPASRGCRTNGKRWYIASIAACTPAASLESAKARSRIGDDSCSLSHSKRRTSAPNDGIGMQRTLRGAAQVAHRSHAECLHLCGSRRRQARHQRRIDRAGPSAHVRRRWSRSHHSRENCSCPRGAARGRESSADDHMQRAAFPPRQSTTMDRRTSGRHRCPLEHLPA